MTESLREIQAQATYLYSEYKHTYWRFNAPSSLTQHKIREHTRSISSLNSWLISYGDPSAAKSPEAGTPLRDYTKVGVETRLREKQHKLNFRLNEAQYGTDEIVSKSRTYYLEHQEAFHRLGLIDAELDGIEIKQTRKVRSTSNNPSSP